MPGFCFSSGVSEAATEVLSCGVASHCETLSNYTPDAVEYESFGCRFVKMTSSLTSGLFRGEGLVLRTLEVDRIRVECGRKGL